MNIEFQKIETQGHKTKRLYLMFRNLMQTKNLNFYIIFRFLRKIIFHIFIRRFSNIYIYIFALYICVFF